MKRSFFILIGFILLFFSCDIKTYTVLIENKSEISVRYSYKNESETLTPGTSKQYITGGYTQSPKNIDVDGTMKIKMLVQADTDTYTFVDIDESEIFLINVHNTLPVDVILRADKFIENPGSSDPTKIDIPAGALIAPEAGIKIYTSKPKFSVFPSYNFDWGINEERTVINVTIRL